MQPLAKLDSRLTASVEFGTSLAGRAPRGQKYPMAGGPGSQSTRRETAVSSHIQEGDQVAIACVAESACAVLVTGDGWAERQPIGHLVDSSSQSRDAYNGSWAAPFFLHQMSSGISLPLRLFTMPAVQVSSLGPTCSHQVPVERNEHSLTVHKFQTIQRDAWENDVRRRLDPRIISKTIKAIFLRRGAM